MSIKKAAEVLRLGLGTRQVRGEAADVLRGSAAKDTTALYELVVHLEMSFAAGRDDVIDELEARTRALASRAKDGRQRAAAWYGESLALFFHHGAKKASECEALLKKAAEANAWYEAPITHLEIGVRSEEALAELANGDGRLLYSLLIAEVDRIDYRNPPSPWLQRAVARDDFWAWLEEQKRAPELVAVAAGDDPPKVPAPFVFDRFCYVGNHGCEQWPVGRRAVLAALMLPSPNASFKVDRAFVSMAKLGDPEAARYLWQRGAKPRSIPEAVIEGARAGSVPVLRLLAELGAKETHFRGALHAARVVESPVIEALVALGAKVNGKVQGRTPLHRVAWEGNEAATETLLGLGADPTAKNKEGLTPAEVAAKQGHIKVAKRLIDASGPGGGIALSGTTLADVRAIFDQRRGALGLSKSDETTLAGLLTISKVPVPLSAALRDPGKPLFLLATALRGAFSFPIRKEKALNLGTSQVIEGALDVAGELIVTNHVLVLGDVKARQVDIDEGGSLAVAGDLRALDVYCGGFLHVPGSIGAPLVTGFDGGTIYAGSTPH